MTSTADKVHALRVARTLIESGEQIYICEALTQAAYDGQSLPAVMELRNHVSDSDSIYPSITLGTWVLARHGMRPPCTPEAGERRHWLFQQCRLAWIDKMIYDLEHP